MRPIFPMCVTLLFATSGFAQDGLDTVKQFYSASEQISMIYTVQKGTKIREGAIQSFHPNGTKALEGTYIKGKLNGPWKSWHANGKPWKEMSFKDDLEDGLSQEWDPRGILLNENNYKAGEYAGTQKTFTADGKPEMEETWMNGKLNGVVRMWESGILIRELFYKNGRLNGLLRAWWSNGNPKAVMTFSDGKPNGMVRNYDELGKLTEEGHYILGERNGTLRRWENGMLIVDQVWEKDICKKGCPSNPSVSSKAK